MTRLAACSLQQAAIGPGPPDDKSPLAIAVETRFEVKLVRAGALLPRQQHHLVTALAPGQLQRVFDHRERHAVAAIGLCRHHVFDDAERLCLVPAPDQRQHAGGDRLFLVRRHHQTDRRIVQQALQGAACVVGAAAHPVGAARDTEPTGR